MTADVLQQPAFILKIDSPDFEFQHSETLVKFLRYSSAHGVSIAHPHKAVDGNALLASAPWAVGP